MEAAILIWEVLVQELSQMVVRAKREVYERLQHSLLLWGDIAFLLCFAYIQIYLEGIPSIMKSAAKHAHANKRLAKKVFVSKP